MTTAAYPPGGTFLDTLKRSFVDVPIDSEQNVSTTEFLEAAESLTTLFDVLGSVAFTPVKSDMLGNVKKALSGSFGKPLSPPQIPPTPPPSTFPQLTFPSGLDFTALALTQNLSTPTEELSASFRAAYGGTLKPHHSFMVKPIFSAAMSACPYRKDFYVKLGEDEGKVAEGLKKWLEALLKEIAILKTFLASKEAKW
ncbi:putative Pleckstrin like proteiny domain-containing family A member 8 [Glarea lozoyensis 74030]|uniref:Putative Pleckstrin like proteiny domain-containing family A member 8 n=1 Tax=Glarea lozoyensis (strain ATCC 74030 / MF5533) TaxID=1104152 RepID=H0ESS6_GLAL7|nr:putative Pleckstrin like proteiny domain-containing family A member 8 [Glarea lozoyensis 74030]